MSPDGTSIHLIITVVGAVVEPDGSITRHDIIDGDDPAAKEPLDGAQRPGTVAFAAGNRMFLTRRLWGAGNAPPYFHDGRFTTLREAILAHAGEAADFLQSLQVLPPGTRDRVVDEHYRPKK